MTLVYDPAENEEFWTAIQQIPGYPAGERIPLRKMVFETGALERLPVYLEDAGVAKTMRLLVVMDSTPIRRGADSLKPLVIARLKEAGWETVECVLTPDASGQVHTDMARIETVKAQLGDDTALLSVGSGTVTDIAKHACHLYEEGHGYHVPFVVYQTANSVSAYTSNMAPVFIQGVKRTLPSRYPEALVCDLETLRDAPREMTVAGVGDLLAAFISFRDWYLAHQLGMDDSFNQFPQTLMGPLYDTILENADGIRSNEISSVAVLAKLISLAGLAMSLSHTTAPLSGYEHVMSHVLDMINEHRENPLAQHGSQVSLAAVVCAEAYQAFLEGFEPFELDLSNVLPDGDVMQNEVNQAFVQVDPSGGAGAECWSDYRQKLEKWVGNGERLADFTRDWERHRVALRRVASSPSQLIDILQRIDAPLHFADLQPGFDAHDVKFAFMNAPLMRKRLTLGDLLIFFNWDRESLWKRIEEKGLI